MGQVATLKLHSFKFDFNITLRVDMQSEKLIPADPPLHTYLLPVRSQDSSPTTGLSLWYYATNILCEFLICVHHKYTPILCETINFFTYYVTRRLNSLIKKTLLR